MSAAPLVLIDLASIIHPTFHMSASEPDPNWTSIQTVARVRALASDQPHVVICCDAPPYLRKDIDPTYKANRPESDATLQHQIALAVETLRVDGFIVWAVKGYEADDVIASAVERVNPTTYLKNPNGNEKRLDMAPARDVIIVSADKDLLQLVGPRVSVKSLRDGSIIDADAVMAKFGVRPDQMGDYLCLVGDASDNIKGAKGIGEKKAAALLATHGTLAALMTPEVANTLTPAIKTSLEEFAFRVDIVRALIALRMDVPVKIEEAFALRVAQEMTMMDEQNGRANDAINRAQTSETPVVGNAADQREPESRVDRAVDSESVDTQARPVTAAVEAQGLPRREAFTPEVMPAPAPAEWNLQLDPRSMEEAKSLSAILLASRLFSAYGSAPQILSTMMYARELNVPAISGLRQIHVIEGKHALSADLMAGLVLKSGFAEYFTPVEISDTKATFKTKRKGADEFSYTYTIEMAQRAGLIKRGSNWEKAPADQLVARAKSKLARLCYPDCVGGLYTPDELRDHDTTEASE